MDDGIKEDRGAQQEPVSQNVSQNEIYTPEIIYMPRRKRRAWIWITLAAVIFCASVGAVFAFSGGPSYREIKGNPGVVALYDFILEQQDAQNRFGGSISKEVSGRLLSEPFEINSNLKVSSDSFGGSGLNNVAIELNAKYDMKDLGVKLSALGYNVLGAYLIGDDLVIELMGRAGSKVISSKGLEKSMPLGERIKEVFPFLPDDPDMYVDLLEKISVSIPDNYAKTDKQQIYSPKEDKKVLMTVTAVTLNAQAVKKVIGNFKSGLETDKILSKKIQNTINDFTQFAGIKDVKLEDWLTELSKLSGSDDIKDVNVTLSVYKRQGKYAGFDISYASGDKKGQFTYLNEFSGKDEYANTVVDINGSRSETLYHYTFEGNKVKFNGRTTSTQGGGLGSTMQTIEGTLDYSKSGANEYKMTGDFSVNGDIHSDSQSTSQTLSFEVGINADIKLGGGLGTLKESRDWKQIYDEKWGSLEELFGSYFGGYSPFFPSTPGVA